MSSKHLVEELLGHKPRKGEYEAQRRYEDLPRFYVAANRYEQGTPIGDHTDSNPLYAVPPSNTWSSVATWSQMGSCGFHPQRRPSCRACRMLQATYPLSG